MFSSQRTTTPADFFEGVSIHPKIPGVRHNLVQRHHPQFGAILSLAAATNQSEDDELFS